MPRRRVASIRARGSIVPSAVADVACYSMVVLTVPDTCIRTTVGYVTNLVTVVAHEIMVAVFFSRRRSSFTMVGSADDPVGRRVRRIWGRREECGRSGSIVRCHLKHREFSFIVNYCVTRQSLADSLVLCSKLDSVVEGVQIFSQELFLYVRAFYPGDQC